MADGVVSIREAVATKIAGSNDKVRESVVEILATAEIERRTQAILTGLKEKDRLEKEIRKIKPDQVVFNEGGEEVSSGYSKAKLEELKKAKEKLQRVIDAVEKALTGTYDKLFEINEKAGG